MIFVIWKTYYKNAYVRPYICLLRYQGATGSLMGAAFSGSTVNVTNICEYPLLARYLENDSAFSLHIFTTHPPGEPVWVVHSWVPYLCGSICKCHKHPWICLISMISSKRLNLFTPNSYHTSTWWASVASTICKCCKNVRKYPSLAQYLPSYSTFSLQSTLCNQF